MRYEKSVIRVEELVFDVIYFLCHHVPGAEKSYLGINETNRQDQFLSQIYRHYYYSRVFGAGLRL